MEAWSMEQECFSNKSVIILPLVTFARRVQTDFTRGLATPNSRQGSTWTLSTSMSLAEKRFCSRTEAKLSTHLTVISFTTLSGERLFTLLQAPVISRTLKMEFKRSTRLVLKRAGTTSKVTLRKMESRLVSWVAHIWAISTSMVSDTGTFVSSRTLESLTLPEAKLQSQIGETGPTRLRI